MEPQSYWNQVLQQRITRRRTLRGAAVGSAGVAAAAFLAACGGGSSGGSTNAGTDNPNANLGPPKDGGTLRMWETLPVLNNGLDAGLNWTGSMSNMSSLIYPKLTTFRSGSDTKPKSFEVKLELADKVEQPDPTTYIFHINDKAQWQDGVAPMNGRTITAEDVVYNMGVYGKVHPNRSVSTPFIDKVEAVDQKTVRFKLKEPLSPFLYYVGQTGGPFMMPPELQESGQSKEKTAGAGPYLLDKIESGSAAYFVKNPKYYRSGLPHIQNIVVSYLTEQATIAANIRTGNLDVNTWSGVPQEVTDDLKKVAKGQWWDSNANSTTGIFVDLAADKVKDERVRVALSVLLNREEILVTQGGGYAYGTPLPPIEFWWLDPKKDAAMTPYFTRDVAKAKQLLSAAGFPNGFEINYTYTASNASSANLPLQYASYFKDAGINMKLISQSPQENAATTALGKTFGGLSVGLGQQTTDPDEGLTLMVNPDSPRSSIPHKELLADDKKYMDLFNGQRRELDRNKRKTLVDDIQRHLATKMYVIPITHANLSFFASAKMKNFYLAQCYGCLPSMLENAWIEE